MTGQPSNEANVVEDDIEVLEEDRDSGTDGDVVGPEGGL